MKKIKMIIRIVFLSLILIVLSNSVYASVEIKDTTSVYTGQTISYFYDLCHQMTQMRQGLEGANVDVHMSNNREWATVAYFSNSNYGTTGAGKNTGVSITLTSGNEHYSTNGNVTGIMDLGKTTSYTSGIGGGYTHVYAPKANGRSIFDNLETDSKIEKVSKMDNVLLACNGWYGATNNKSSYWSAIYSARIGFFGFDTLNGAASDTITFRPVFYN